MIIERTIETLLSVNADLAYAGTVMMVILAIAMISTALWVSYKRDWREVWFLYPMSGATGLMAYQLHGAYLKSMALANGASSGPFYEMVGWIALGSLCLAPLVAIFVCPCKQSKD
jgi:hypothetical protein